MDRFEYWPGEQNVGWFNQQLQDGLLNLNPAFQRDSVWPLAKRRKLIHSLFARYPIPSVLLYRRMEGKAWAYDVIDGKQRLESVFLYIGAKGYGKKSFWFEAEPRDLGLDEDKHAKPTRVYWKDLDAKQRHHLLACRIPTITVDGDPDDIIDLFVRLNSTGEKLRSAEIMKAKYLKSAFLRRAARLATQLEDRLVAYGVCSATEVRRMRHLGLIADLMGSCYRGHPLDRKAELDRVIAGARGVPESQLAATANEVKRAVERVLMVFPDLASTRLRGISHFYSLCLLAAEWESEHLVFKSQTDRKLAASTLRWFGEGLDRIKMKHDAYEAIPPEERSFVDYWMTLQEGTDSRRQRERRAAILRGVFRGFFDQKDQRRLFTPEQRRIVWLASRKRQCTGCKAQLRWDTFTVHHIKAHKHGGKTDLANAALLCRPCNSKLGAGGY